MARFARGGLDRGSTGILGQRGVLLSLLRYWLFWKMNPKCGDFFKIFELVKHYCWIRKNKIDFLKKMA